MKKRFIIIMVLVLSYFLVGCQLFNPNRNEPQYKIYEMAKEVGFEGTYEEWLQTIRGIDGTSIKKVELDKDNNLIITLSNGEVINVGNVKGDKGDEIELSVIDGYIKWHYKGSNEWYNLIEVNTLIGEKGDKGDEVEISVIEGYIKWHYKGSNEWYNLIEVSTLIGLQGPKGEDGVSIVKTELDKDNNLIITLSNGKVLNLGNVKGDKGDTGNTGKSAYEIYKEKHPEYTKTEEEWLDDLVNGRLATKEVYTVKFITNTEEEIEDQKVEENKKIIKPKNPEKTGYTFIGWFNEYDEQWVFGGYNVTSNVTLYAKYKANTYKITLDNKTIIEVEYDSPFTLPVVEKEGYRFIKWIDSNNEEVRSGVYKYTNDLSLSSFYGKEYTITFDSNGGNDINSIKAYTNIKVDLPTPFLDGYTFIGWFNGETQVSNPFVNTVETDITLKAHYRSTVGDYEVEEIENNEIKILKYKGTDKEVIIPNKINDKVVTILGDASFKDNTQIEKVILSKDIKEVGNNVFNGCTSLKEVIFNSGINTYKDNILLNCNSLESITIDVLNQSLIGFFDYEESNIPSTFTSINYLSKDNASDASKMFNSITSHLFDINIPSSWNEVPYKYFRSNSLIKKVNLEEGITSIKSQAFSGCTSLQKIELPNTITSIYNNAFYGCSSLQEITLPNTITSIGDSAFSSCTLLKTINLQDTITSISNNLFFDCKSLNTIILPDTITSIGRYAFQFCSSLKIITLPKGITSIGDSAFYYCKSLKGITLPDTITSIGGSAFAGCTSLTDVFYEGNKSEFINQITIGTSNYYLTNANIHYNSDVTLEYVSTDKYSYVLTSSNEICSLVCNDNTVETVDLCKEFEGYVIYTLGHSSFRECTSLKTITLSNSISIIWSSAFSNCTSLRAITLSNNITSIGSYAFDGCSSLTDVFYEGNEEEFNKITIGANNSYLASANIHYNSNVILEYIETEKYSYVLTSDNEIYELNYIGTGAKIIDLCKEFREYKIKSLADHAFYDSGVLAITLPNTIERFGNYIFYEIQVFTEVFYQGSSTEFYEIKKCENSMPMANIHFNSNVTLEYIETEKYSYVLTSNNLICVLSCNDNTLESIDLVEDFKEYDLYSLSCSAFSICSSLKSLTISKSLKLIGFFAFDNCPSLTDVYYDGTEEEFSNITIGDYNSYFKNATIHYNESATLE